MADDPANDGSDADPSNHPSNDMSGATPPVFREVDGWAALSYILTGVLFYGAIGWLVDAWLGTRGFVAGGIVVWLRYSKS
jgi:hypothetical protein